MPKRKRYNNKNIKNVRRRGPTGNVVTTGQENVSPPSSPGGLGEQTMPDNPTHPLSMSGDASSSALGPPQFHQVTQDAAFTPENAWNTPEFFAAFAVYAGGARSVTPPPYQPMQEITNLMDAGRDLMPTYSSPDLSPPPPSILRSSMPLPDPQTPGRRVRFDEVPDIDNNQWTFTLRDTQTDSSDEGSAKDVSDDNSDDPWTYSLRMQPPSDDCSSSDASEQASQGSRESDFRMSDDEEDIPVPPPLHHSYDYRQPPSFDDARAANVELKQYLRPRRNNGKGFKNAPHLPLLLRTRLEWVSNFLNCYSSPSHKLHNARPESRWTAASLEAAFMAQKGPWFARRLREWAKAYVLHRTLPTNKYGTWTKSKLEDEDFANELALHLQSKGKYVRAMDIVDYTARPDVRKRLGRKKAVSLKTAQRWMKVMGYRWKKGPSGQFTDGHEREDVVWYRQNEFIPAFTKIEKMTRAWIFGNWETYGPLQIFNFVIWFHDESTFYANDRRQIRWVHSSEKAKPRAKGEGPSEMVSDFVSAEYGWLGEPEREDGQPRERVRVLFKAGKNRDGYFTNDDIIKQTTHAMEICEKHYPAEKHVFIFDNATTHTKREEDALSARKMPKKTSKIDKNWMVKATVTDENGSIVYDSKGKPQKMSVKMRDTVHPVTGQHQSLYFPEDHAAHPGCFKGMAVILEERGLHAEAKLRAECKDFKCAKGATQCCCRRVLYNQPDFKSEKSILETLCERRGFQVLFLPKFHCELNFIEQCWGAAKRVYREFPESSKEADLECNVIAALDSVPLETMRKYAARALRFIDAYRHDLDGKESATYTNTKLAAYASKQYKSHRTIPMEILKELDKL